MDRREFFRHAGIVTLCGPRWDGSLSAGAPAVTSGSGAQALQLFLAGDVMTGRGIDQILPHSVEPTLHEPYVDDARTYVRIAEERGATIPEDPDFAYPWGEALDELAALRPSARIVNLETAVTTHSDPWPSKGIHYRMHPGNVPVLTVAGIDAAALGNNHVLDWGREGLRETLASLRGAGLATPGAGLDADEASSGAVIRTGAGRVLVFSYGSPSSGVYPEWAAGPDRPGVNLLPELGTAGAERVAEDVSAQRRTGDRVVVSVHWGGNWGYDVPDEQRDFAHRLVELGGADVVHGHSSHHPKGIEVHRGRLILYGAGDFLNDYEGIGGHGQYRGELTLMYFPTLAADGTVSELIMTPMRIQDFQLRRADAEGRRWLREMLDRESMGFGAGVEETAEGRLKLAWG